MDTINPTPPSKSPNPLPEKSQTPQKSVTAPQTFFGRILQFLWEAPRAFFSQTFFGNSSSANQEASEGKRRTFTLPRPSSDEEQKRFERFKQKQNLQVYDELQLPSQKSQQLAFWNGKKALAEKALKDLDQNSPNYAEYQQLWETRVKDAQQEVKRLTPTK